MKRNSLKLLFVLLTFSLNSNAQVVINEFSAANFDEFQDNFGEYEDWIELYNAGNNNVNLSGYYLSDRFDDPFKYVIPGGTTIPANGILRLWASGNNSNNGGVLHTNFKITQTREAEGVILSNNMGAIVDTHSITVPNKKNHSWARISDGNPTWGVSNNPTPNASNSGVNNAYATRPEISPPAGVYGGAVLVEMSSPDPDVTIYYSTDGSNPGTGSTPYSGPFTLTVTSVVKAIAVSSDSNTPSSHVDVHTYFVNEAHSIPIVSISGNNLPNLLGGNNGLEPEGYFEYFDDAGNRVSDSSGEFNKHGNDSWAYAQRGFDYIARDQFGDDFAIKHKIFDNKSRTNFQRVIMKAAANDNYPFANGAHIRDSYVHELSQRANLELDERSHQSCILYMNGEYWGVYDIREKVDDHDYTKYYYDQGRQWIDFIKTWGNTWAEYGTMTDWNALHNFIVSNDMSDAGNYAYVGTQLELISLIDYMIINTHTVCKDWLNWNTAWWRGRKPNGDAKKWRYTLWDMDATFGHYINYTGIPDVTANADPCDVDEITTDFEGHVEMLQSLLENEDFFALYINRYADLNNTYLSCDYMVNLLDEMTNKIDPEMAGQVDRWGGNYNTWLAEVDEVRDFILDRCNVIDSGIEDCYDVVGPFDISINVAPVSSGHVKVNDIMGQNYPWLVSYFGGVNITLTAIPFPGNEFSHWTSDNNPLQPNNNTITVTADLVAAGTITAHFNTAGCDLTPVINGPADLCDGNQSVLSVTESFATYLWSDNSTTQSITVSTPGSYSVTVSDGQNCTASTAYTLGTAPAPAVAIVGDAIFCENENTVLDAGDGFASYLWSDGTTDQVILVEQSGMYDVIVTNAEGCTGMDQIMINEVPLPTPAIDGESVICENATTILSVEDIYESYLWSDGSTDPAIIIDQAGDHGITVVDFTGCVGEAMFSVSINPPPAPSILGDENICANENSLLDGGDNWTTYLWSDNSTEQTLSINTPGTYQLTVSDNAGCTGSDEIVIAQSPEVSPEISGNLSICNEESTLLSLDQVYSSYLWSDNSTEADLAVNLAGSFQVTVTNAEGCTGIDMVEVVQSPPIAAEIIGELVFCNNSSTTLSLSENYASYLWSNNATTPELEVLTEGSYSVTVSDASGCTAENEVIVLQNEELQTEINGELNFCEGENTILFLEESYESYLWSDNSTDETLMVEEPGAYSIVVTDTEGCTATADVLVEVSPNLNPEITGNFQLCENGNTLLSLSENYETYQWGDNSEDENLEVTTAGTYSVMVSDANGCTGETSIEVIQNPAVNPAILGDPSFCIGESTILSLSENYDAYQWSDGSDAPTFEATEGEEYIVTVTDGNGCTGFANITITASEAVEPQIIGSTTFCEGSNTLLSLDENYETYLWSDGSTEPTLEVDQQNSYEVIVTNSLGCSGTIAIDIIQSEEIEAQITGSLSLCDGENTELSLSQDYESYLWSDGSTDAILDVNSAGNYTVAVTDASGCSGTAVAEIVENEAPVATINGELNFCENSNTTLSLSEDFEEYLWEDNSTGATITVEESGTYNVTVTDENGCTTTTNASITTIENPMPQVIGEFNFCEGESTIISLEDNYSSYLWSNGSSDETLVVQEPGEYDILVTNNNGCSGEVTFTVYENDPIQAEIIGATSFCEGSTTTLSLSQNYTSYQWSDNSTLTELEVSDAGTYSVVIADDNGCTGTAEIEVTISDEIQAEIIGATSFCEGSTTTLSLSQNYTSYQWNDNSTLTELEVSEAGTYSVVIADDNGCTGTAEIEVTISDEIQAEIIGATSFCEGSTTTLSLSQ
ncbi:MAG: CotH kinase family protein, partial [Saprospiraceae bacterium]